MQSDTMQQRVKLPGDCEPMGPNTMGRSISKEKEYIGSKLPLEVKSLE